MARNVKGSALAVGEVIQDRANTGDEHPYVVVATSTYQITLRNCTSHETSALTLVKVKKEDKTGDGGWSGKDSYVVKSGNTTDLSVYAVVPEVVGYDNAKEMMLMQFPTPDGKGVYFDYVETGKIVAIPRVVNRYSDILYRVVGGIKAERMTTLLEELAA